MKQFLLSILVLALLTCAVSAVCEETNILDFPECGFTFEAPESLNHLTGQFNGISDRGEAYGFGSGILEGALLYMARTPEEKAAYVEKIQSYEELTDEAKATVDEYLSRSMELVSVFGINGGRSFEETINSLLTESSDFPYKKWVELGSYGDFTYWMAILDFDSSFIAPYLKDWPQVFVDEIKTLSEEIISHPEAVTLKERKVSFQPPVPGTKISFTATDLDGNPVSSDELFARSKVTLVNIWRTWCEPCVEELPELDEINRNYADKGGAVITWCADATDTELTDLARNIAGSYSFVSLTYSDSIQAALPWRGTPTTYFVDSEGTILGYPIVGALPDQYLLYMDAYLSGDTVVPPADEAPATEEMATYTVLVVDQNGDPVPKVYVTFCTAEACSIAVSDENGIITYEGVPYRYHIDIKKVPAGYSHTENDEIHTDEHTSSLTLTITKD